MNLHATLIAAAGILLLAAQTMAFDYPKDSVIYEGAAGATKVKITASTRPFARADHKTTELRNMDSEVKQAWWSATNGTALRPVFEENGHEKPGSYACVRV